MDRIAYFLLTPEEKYPMVYTLAAAKAINDRWGDLPGLYAEIRKEVKGLNFQPLLFAMELLIRQGCAYMNTFQHDLPIVPGIPLTKRGFYKPITGEQIAKTLLVEKITYCVETITDAYEKSVKPTISASLTANAGKPQESSNELAWFDYHCRTFGMSQKEYHLLTLGEIQDLATCRAIQNGAMQEEIDTPYLPNYL